MFCCCAQEAEKTETIKIFDGELTTGENVGGMVQTEQARNSAVERTEREEEKRRAEEEQARIKAEEERARVKAEEDKAAEERARAEEQKLREAEDATKAADAKTTQTVGNPLQFSVNLKKGTKTTPVGLELDTAGGTCAMVTKIVEGVVLTYNKTAADEQKVLVGDVIIQVNQAIGDTKTMGQQAMQATNLDLVVKRPVEFVINIDKTEPPGVLGIDFEYLAVGRSLLIKGIKSGLIKKWNDAYPNMEVRRLDRIVGVNGFSGESEKMLEMMKESDKLELTIARIFSSEELKAS